MGIRGRVREVTGMRLTIYVLMETELDEALIDRPESWDTWDAAQRADWATIAKEQRENDLSLLEEWFLLLDTRDTQENNENEISTLR